MKCENCKHWEKPRGGDYGNWEDDFGECRHTPHGPDLGQWNDEMEWVMEPEYADRTAVVQDASGYAATLHTKADHFCAMFKDADT